MKDEEKAAHREAVFLELVRAMMLQRKDLNLKNEEDAAVYATWYLLNPLSLPKREKLELYCERRFGKSGKQVFRFTAHAHHDEPLKPSPDDMLIYDQEHQNENRSVHYIADRFFIEKIL